MKRAVLAIFVVLIVLGVVWKVWGDTLNLDLIVSGIVRSIAEVVQSVELGKRIAGLDVGGGEEAEVRGSGIIQPQADTVFAVRISVPNPDHILKPGMPADARLR